MSTTTTHARDILDLRSAVARALEENRWNGAASRTMSRAWALVAAKSLARPFVWPQGARVIAVGGATLGGSGATPLAIACARALAEMGARVAFIGHAYRAKPREPRVVASNDSLAAVGDEALLAHRALEPCGVPVIVAPSRQEAVFYAADRARVLVVDGALQARPDRVALSLLAVAADRPWGARHAPPRGDLRAPIDALVAAADVVVRVGAIDNAPASHEATARVAVVGARSCGQCLRLDDLALRRVGLVTAHARPRRVEAELARHGIVPRVTAMAGDHATPSRRFAARLLSLASDHALDGWIACDKAALALSSSAIGAPLMTLDREVVLSTAVRARLAAVSRATS